MTIRYGAGGVPYAPTAEQKDGFTEVKTKTTVKPKKQTISSEPVLEENQVVLQELIDENSEILND